MAPPIKVFICDDSIMIRHLLTVGLGQDPELKLIGQAPNGKLGSMKIPEAQPDVVVMDVEMPEMSGIDAVKTLRKNGFSRPIIMFSTLTERGADATLDALTSGAQAYVHKPNQGQNAEEALQEIRRFLIPKIKELANAKR